MQVSALWRYPVKSLAGESLDSALLTLEGVAGDRVVHVRGSRGLLTGRTRHALLSLPGGTGPDGAPLVAGEPWDSPRVAGLVQEAAGPDALLVPYIGHERFDVLNLLVATDGAIDLLGHDVRRLRPNLVISGVEADAERTWPGQALAIGEVLIGLHSVRQRCIVTTIDPDTGDQELDVLRKIRRDFGGEIALNSWVIRPGTIRVGDHATLVPTSEVPERLGGWIVGAPYLANLPSSR